MAIAKDELYGCLMATFLDATIYIKELADDEDHYAVEIISSAFVGKSRIEQHKMVYNALGGQVGTRLHALSLTTIIKEG